MCKKVVSKGKLGALYLVFSLCILTSPAGSAEPDTAPTGIKYINPTIPTVNLPAYAGQRYKAVVPDTFDIQEMARLAVHGLTSLTDPDYDYEIYWYTVLVGRNPVTAKHDWSDSTGSKYVEALPLTRLASGSTENMHVEQRWAEVMLHMQSPDDGIYYFPKNGVPWSNVGVYARTETPGDHYSIIYTNGRYIGAATNYYKLTGDEMWKVSAKRAIDGLINLATYSDDPPGEDKAWFDWFQYGTGGEFNIGGVQTHNLASWFSWLILGSAEYYEATGYEPAKTFSGQLSRWIINDSNHFEPDGTFKPEHPGQTRIHFHGHTMSLVSMLDYATIAEDTAVRDFVNSSFLFARDHPKNNALVGYFPEDMVGAGNEAETCEVADMIALALKLSQAGAGDYWDDADRWIRNQFVESQLKDGDWIDAAVAGLGMTSAAFNETNDNVSERLVGNFAGNARANEFGGLTMGCCTGNASRTVYWIWENILSHKDGRLKVNLLMNRASPWADVDSYIPYEGRVDVKVKKACDLSIRIPEWVKPEEVQCKVNGKKQTVTFDGRYASLGDVKAKDVVRMIFPIFERTDKVNIVGKAYTIIRKGNDVVHIDPPGKYNPYYQRDHYRRNKARMKSVERFVAAGAESK